jgi:hypothetical protein
MKRALGLWPALAAGLLAACGHADPAPAPADAVASTAMPPRGSTLTAEAGAFVLRLEDGRVLRGTELTGAIVHVSLEGGRVAPMRIASVTRDPKQPEVLRHEFETSDGHGGWKNACPPNPDGETWGLPLSLPVGHPGRDGEITVSCISGVVAKCVRWGYPPWSKGPGGEDLMPFHAACVRMARADYCGDGHPHTKQGTSIDNYDDLGIQRRGAADDATYVFEAGWSPQGAVCVAHPRWEDQGSIEQIRNQCPRLAAVPRCDEASARALGARMFNYSRIK